jgi:hypothetical protein
VITQGPDTRGGLRQEDLDQLERFPEHAIGVGGRETLSFIRTSIPAIQTEEFDNVSIASDVPEPPLSPQSDLGIFTPSFDTRSEVSAASREPASPTSSLTDLASSDADGFATGIPPAINGSSSSLTADRDDITPQYTPLAAFKDVPDIDSDGFMRSNELTPVSEVFVGHHNEPKALPKTLDVLYHSLLHPYTDFSLKTFITPFTVCRRRRSCRCLPNKPGIAFCYSNTQEARVYNFIAILPWRMVLFFAHPTPRRQYENFLGRCFWRIRTEIINRVSVLN